MNLAPAVVSVFLVAAAMPLLAQSGEQDTPDPPNRVARINWLSGDVSFQPAGLEEWTAATVNYPLTTNDHLFTGKDSRAELHIGTNAIRLDSNTNFGFLNLDDSILQVSVTEGSFEIHLRERGARDTVEVATPNGAITLLQPGDYRIDTDPGRDASMLTVQAGLAELLSGNNTFRIRAQQTAYFQTDQNPNIQTANAADDFDKFVASREGDGSPAPGNRLIYDTVPDLVAEQITGAEDLNQYGTWENSVVSGEVWVPQVAADWVPYSDGKWAYIEPWGWTWIDNAAWGFTPFHYGRWTYIAGRWAWAPGDRESRKTYAPALVAFMGGGAADNVSWFPLSPRDSYSPPWRPNNGVLPRISGNRNVPGAVRTMSQTDFLAGGHGKPVMGLVADGHVLGSAPSVKPVRASVLIGETRVAPRRVERPLIARTGPPAPIVIKAVSDLKRSATPVQRPAVRYSVPLPVKAKPVAKPVKPSGDGGGAARRP